MSDLRIPRWLKSPHLQTVIGAAPIFSPPRSHRRVPTDLLRIPLPTGAPGHALHARAWWQEAGAGARPAVVLAHGIGGSAESRCVVRAAVALHRRGFHVVRLDMRGAGASTPDSPSLYHGGLSADLGTAVGFVARDPRVSNVVLFGFSGGGSMSLKLAGECGEDVPEGLACVVSVSAPLDYTRVAPWMDELGRLPYRFHVLGGLVASARAFVQHHPGRSHFGLEDLRGLRTFRAFDGGIIAPMHGFPDVDTYYARASSGPWLERIRVPTLLVHADDDPMVPRHTVTPWIAKASSAVTVVRSREGGHIGWLAGLDEASWISGWATSHAIRFIEQRLAS
jgi:predicted alpha/beta-fold hydrolase